MTISDKYFVKQGTDSFQDFTVKFNGLTILKIDNFDKKGKAKNIYTQSWVNSSSEDVFVPDVVYFEQPDLDITFMVTDSYNTSIDVQSVHDSFIDYMTTHRVTIKSLYAMKQADFVCLAEYKPTLTKVKRSAGNNYITGTITMHRVTPNTTVAE